MTEFALAVFALWFIAFVANVFFRLGCLLLVAGFFVVLLTGFSYA